MPPPPWLKRKVGNFNKRPNPYIPAPKSGAYTILVAMYHASEKEFIQNMKKQQVLDYCTKYSQASIGDSSKTWASMKGLIDRSLIGRHISRDPDYYLTEEGKDLAQKLIELPQRRAEELSSQDEASTDTQQPLISSQQSASNHDYVWNEGDPNFELKANSYDIILVVDQREKIDIFSLDGSVKKETRTLACGDFLWIARPKGIGSYDRTKDLVLDYVVERKRLDDLSSSIMDGRFEQQKQRLKNTGIRRPVYLIEECASLRNNGLTKSGLAQAVVGILINDGIDVEKVKNSNHSNDYLVSMTKCLEKFYLNKDIMSCSQERMKNGDANENEFMTFSEFQTKGAKIKNWTVREMFAKHLIQILGMSDKRVAVIIKEYPTMSALIKAYRKCNSVKEKEDLLSKLKIPDSNRTIGPALSKRVYACYARPSNVVYDDEED